jgi:hypothetical protein
MSGAIYITLELKPSPEFLTAMHEVAVAIQAHASAITEADARTAWLSDMDQLIGRQKAEQQPTPPVVETVKPPVPAAPISKAPPPAVVSAPKAAPAAVPSAPTKPGAWATDERKTALRLMYPADTHNDKILAELVRLGGPPLPPWPTIQTYAIQTLHLKRKDPNQLRRLAAGPSAFARAMEQPRAAPDTTTPIVTDAETIRARVAAWGKQFSGPADLAGINAHAKRIGHRPFELEESRRTRTA